MSFKFKPAACVLLLSSAGAIAEPLEILITTGQFRPMNVSETTSQVTVIGRDELDKHQAETVADAIKAVPGVQVAAQGGSGQIVSFGIRGSGSNQVLVLIDGVRFGSATAGQASLEQVPLELVERIEVLRGPRSSVYGSDAIGGVINIVTKGTQHDTLEVSLTGGSHDYYSGNLHGAISGLDGRLRGSFSAGQSQEQGFDVLAEAEPDADGSSQLSLQGRVEYDVDSALTLFSSVLDTTGDVDFDNAFGGANKSDYDNRQLVTGLMYRELGRGGDVQMAYSRNQLDSYRDEPGKPFFDNLVSERTSIEATGWQEITPELTLSGGSQLYREDVSQSQTQFAVNQRDVRAVFARAEYLPLSPVSLDGGLRYEDIEGVDDALTWSVGASWKLPQARVGLSADTSFRAPTFNDLYYPDSGFSRGNPDLLPEQARTIELFVKDLLPVYGNLAFSVYRTEYDNLIQWQPDDLNDPFSAWAPQNVAQATITGLEADMAFDYAGLQHQLSLTLMEAVDGAGEHLVNRPKQTVFWRLSRNWGLFSPSLTTRYVGDRGPGLSAYTTVDTALSYRLRPDLNLRARISNLLDEQYQAVNGYNAPGRTAYLTVDYRL